MMLPYVYDSPSKTHTTRPETAIRYRKQGVWDRKHGFLHRNLSSGTGFSSLKTGQDRRICVQNTGISVQRAVFWVRGCVFSRRACVFSWGGACESAVATD